MDVGPNAGNFGTDDFTIEFWINTTLQNSWQAIMSKRVVCGNAPAWWDLRMRPSGALQLEFQDEVNYTWVGSDNRPVNDGSWHYVAITRTGTIFTAFVDGYATANTTAPSVNSADAALEVRFGISPCDGWDGTVPFRGSLDEISFYGRALTASEVAAQSLGTCIGVAP